jgi:hypothetical protein
MDNIANAAEAVQDVIPHRFLRIVFAFQISVIVLTDKQIHSLLAETFSTPSVMCGRRLIDKSFLTLMQHWSGAVMCVGLQRIVLVKISTLSFV